jgi:D-glycero-D-manno-heptose 1,7-bisphosphate phosphatase
MHHPVSESQSPRRSAVFLDRDGVISVNRADYVKSWDEFIFLPGALDSLRSLAEHGMPVIVISNQSAIGRGLLSRQTADEINRRMQAEVEAQGGRLDAVYICPHTPDEKCDCRKPRPGLLYQAAEEHQLDLQSSYFVGDALSDVEAALAVGCLPLLVLTGRGLAQRPMLEQLGLQGVKVVADIAKAVRWIITRGDQR